MICPFTHMLSIYSSNFTYDVHAPLSILSELASSF